MPRHLVARLFHIEAELKPDVEDPAPRTEID